ncbi:MAG: HNH endonuclease [Bacilli bacterium]|nr:HNH endonuclease [Bacilli bacterium]
MEIIAKVYSGYKETYKRIYKDVVERVYKLNGININKDEIIYEVEVLEGDTVQSQRSKRVSSRTITILENGKIKYIVGLSNTGYDDDKLLENPEFDYGHTGYHANTYFVQGCNKIFDYYLREKEKNSNIKLYFYMLDVNQSHPHDKFNLMIYRKLATIGFDVLNIEQIKFDEYIEMGFSIDEIKDDIKYISFNKFSNDLSFISSKNSGNVPSYIKCIDYSYDINKETDDENEEKFVDLTNQEYIYTFKTLSAEGYDSFLTMWTLSVLAEKENKKLKFMFAPEKYNFRLGQEVPKVTEGFTGPLIDLMEKIGLSQEYETTDEVRQQINREINQYEISKANGTIRNQELFKNNLRRKGILTKCYLCGCEIEHILEAAHLWGVSEIKKCNAHDINDLLSNSCMNTLIDPENEHSSELFYKKYMLANSGDNGVWLCSNHHGLFDSNFYCFDSETGKVLIKLDANEIDKTFFELCTSVKALPKEFLTDRSKIFLSKREEKFNRFNQINESK